MSDPVLFEAIPPPRKRGRVRQGLEDDVTAARESGVELSAASVETLRTLADNIDSLDYALRFNVKPYDRMPVAALVHEFGETYDRVFAAVRADSDPLTRALAEFTAAENRDPAGPRGD